MISYGIKEVYHVSIKFETDEEQRSFNEWYYESEIYPVVRGGTSGNKRRVGFYSKEDAERIRDFLKTNGGHFTPLLNKY